MALPPTIFTETARYKLKKPVQGKSKQRWGEILNNTIDMLDNITYSDEFPFIENKDDSTKKLKFDISSVPSGTQIVLTVPPTSGTIALLSDLAALIIHDHSDAANGGPIDLAAAAAGILAVLHGGTGATNPQGARSNLRLRTQSELFPIGISHTQIFQTSFIPRSETVQVIFNGIVLSEGTTRDYTISGDVVTLNAGVILTPDDLIKISYQY